VVLDSATGRVLFRESRKTPGYSSEALPLLFSPDGKNLFAGFNADYEKTQFLSDTVEYALP
jgi:hypothetical protein